RESRRQVTALLELDGVLLPAGIVDVEVAEPKKTAVVPPREREVVGKTLRLGLWTDEALHGVRLNVVETFARSGGKVIKQRLRMSVENRSEAPREVWIEERLRPGKQPTITGAPAGQTIVDGIARIKIVVQAKSTESIAFEVVSQP
ncbi:MAG: hypothetical protein H0V17_29375, partial [Deltaproteobacteria bacterium]|nr:hypothetical protein [Deltaproteobacteria bacterium]